MKFEVWQQGIVKHPLLKLDASSERDAWKQIRQVGIKNKSKLIELIKVI